MTEATRGLFYLPMIYLCTGGVEAHMLASLAPPVHLSGDRLGWTLLVCVVGDFRRGRLEISWSEGSKGQRQVTPFNSAVSRRHRGHNAVSTITVATGNWPSYRCSVRRRHHSKAKKRHSTAFSDDEDKTCYIDEDEEKDEETDEYIMVWTNTAVILALRLLLMKILTFNTLMTTYVVIKW
ncbi:hypothetical protein OJAV_G00090190 [Oryzias javanicus]|uniref:Ig-like domain-containing protein n=1 Tax=Oryzias javanicus TaxID=123683 RepID=A0A437D025_ORYJA|nr:hypothetical protein OJAV_G00090190 [Oryzias javanicus]